MATRRVDRDLKYTEPSGRTESARTETLRRTQAEQPAATTAARAAWTEPAAAEPPGRTGAEPTGQAGMGGAAPGPTALPDRVTGGPVWSGFIIGFATWILLELGLVALGLTGIRGGEGETVNPSEWWWSLAAGLIALFVGGLVAGMASRWGTTAAGVLQGLTVWALSFAALLLLGALGAGLGFGAFSDVASVNTGTDGGVPTSVISTAEDAAGVAFLLLLATAAAAVIGGLIGARIRLGGNTPKGSEMPAGRRS